MLQEGINEAGAMVRDPAAKARPGSYRIAVPEPAPLGAP